MSIFGKDRQFMSDLELEEANASLLNDSSNRHDRTNKTQQQLRNTQPSLYNKNANKHQRNSNTITNSNGNSTQNQQRDLYNNTGKSSSNTASNANQNSRQNLSQARDTREVNATGGPIVDNRRESQDSTRDREFNDIFSQLGQNNSSRNRRKESSSDPRRRQPNGSQGASRHSPGAQEEDLIDMNSDVGLLPPLGRNGTGARGMSPVHSDHPSDFTDTTWNSRAGLVAAPPASRPSTQPRPSGGPGVTSQPRPSYTQRDRGSAIEQEPGYVMNTGERNTYQRGFSTGDRSERYQTMPRPITPPRPEMEMGTAGYGTGPVYNTYGLDTLQRGGGGGGMDDDRRSHFSVATSVVSTVPLSTQPAATKTMSGLYALLLIMLGVAVTMGDIVSRRSYDPKYADFYAMYVYGGGTIAALYLCLACIYGKRRGSAPVDHHNGSIYIRIGAAVFCLGSLAHSAIIIAETFQYQDHCYIYARLGSISLRALFQVTQLFVVLIHSKVCIQSWNGLARLVLAHVIAANFLMWFNITLKETLESIVVNVPRHYHNIRMFCQRDYANSFTDMEEESNPILVPMAVAYCVIAGFMLFSMWRNIGKDYSVEHREESCEEHEKQLSFQCREGVLGVMAGAFSILASISILVLWIMFSNDRSLYDYLVSIYQTYNAIWLGILILLFPVAAAALKRHRKQDHYHNSLNRPILILTTTGTFAYCILNIMSSAVLIIHSFSILALATLVGYSVHTIQAAIQTVYLLDGLRRCPRRKRKPPSKSFVLFFLLVNVSLWITIIFELKETSLNPLQEDFYGIINWNVMLHFVGPIASLYRFHSVCCFIDVWKFAY